MMVISGILKAQPNDIGNWMQDSNGLPCFNYTGSLPYSALLPNQQKVKLSEDPWFLLGNYQLTLFTHVSGQYELITGQRAWGRMNQGSKPNTGANNAYLVTINNKNEVLKKYQLTGMSSLASNPSTCKRVFGCGFANYTYQTDNLTIKRIISVKPSSEPTNGTSAFLLTVKIKNNSREKVNLIYNESVTANYETMQQQNSNDASKKVKYSNRISIDQAEQLIKADIKGVTDDPLLFPNKESASMFEGYPPALFLKALTAGSILKEETPNELSVKYPVFLQPREEKTIEIVIGYSFENETSSIRQITGELSLRSNEPIQNKKFNSESAYSSDWQKILPKFENEADLQLKQELIWHAYNLEAMATYSEYYKETKIPQGTIYDYDWGQHASARDNFQHALPLVYYNPKLAKSVLRYMLKRTTAWGEIRLIEMGNGYADNYSYFTSDQQLFFFLLLSEYLRVTHDYDFLAEEVACYPVMNATKMPVLKFVEKCFGFLRDEIGTGTHGLVRLMNSDWNDAVFYLEKAPYNKVLYSGESHMNSAMAITILKSLTTELENAGNISSRIPKIDLGNICKSMDLFRNKVLTAFMSDLGDRSFSRRMYFNGHSYGDDNMFLEPQAYMLQMTELSVERKKRLYEEMKKRVYTGEKLGAREQQNPEFEGDGWEKGSRENGGFWYALNGPAIIGIAQYDMPEAKRLLHLMTLRNYSKQFPKYWSSYWSAADNVESSLIPEEGLPDQTWNYATIPVYCAHPHAWILYCYYKLNSK